MMKGKEKEGVRVLGGKLREILRGGMFSKEKATVSRLPQIPAETQKSGGEGTTERRNGSKKKKTKGVSFFIFAQDQVGF